MKDPFADDEDTTTTGVGGSTATENGKPTVTPTEDGKVVVTLKGGRDYDAPWIVIHAADVEDANVQLSDPELKPLIEQTAKVAKFFAKTNGGGQPQGGGQQQSNGKPAGAEEAPGGEKQFCKHGEKRFDTKISKKTKKPYSAFFCTGPQSDQDESANCGISFPEK